MKSRVPDRTSSVVKARQKWAVASRIDEGVATERSVEQLQRSLCTFTAGHSKGFTLSGTLKDVVGVCSCGAIMSVLLLGGCVGRIAVSPESPREMVIDRQEFVALAEMRFQSRDSIGIPSRFNSPVIHPGDQLSVTVYEKLPVSQDARIEMKRVSEDGTILLPPIGVIRVGGFSLTEAAKVIEDALSRYIVSPFCEIEITQKGYQPRVFIYGEVEKSGVFPLRPGDRLLDALSSAGGCSDNAYRRSIKLVRSYDDKVGMISIDLFDLLDRGGVQDNFLLHDQDIIFVPRRFYTSFQEVMSALGNVLPWYFFVRSF